MNICIFLVFNSWKFYEAISSQNFENLLRKETAGTEKKEGSQRGNAHRYPFVLANIEPLMIQRRQRGRNSKKDTSTFVNACEKMLSKKN
jgi:hypothetical protein